LLEGTREGRREGLVDVQEAYVLRVGVGCLSLG
jgi:hypothetical protein